MSEIKKSVKKRRVKKLPDDFIIIDNPVVPPSTDPDIPVSEAPVAAPTKKLQTEDLGKIFEMAVCLLYDIPFDGKYKYSMEEADALKTRIEPLLLAFPHKIRHTAKNGSQYDFSGAEDESIKLSAKTTKKDGKVCPQVIGQPSKKKFCQFFSLDVSMSLEEIKTHIESNVADMLAIYFDLTFDCPVVYFNQKTNILQLIKITKKIEWSANIIEFSHKKKNKQWGESSTISITGVTIGEFQVHNHRDCIKFRWAFENLLRVFADSFDVISL